MMMTERIIGVTYDSLLDGLLDFFRGDCGTFVVLHWFGCRGFMSGCRFRVGFGVVGVMVIVLCFALALTSEEPEDLEFR